MLRSPTCSLKIVPKTDEITISGYFLVYYCDRKAVVSFAAHGLDCRSADAWLRGKQFIEATHTLNARIAAGGINYCSVTHDIIGNDQATGTGKLERPFEVIGIIWLVGINKDRVKWTVTLGSNLGERRECLPKA